MIEVLSSGLPNSVQDLGRKGFLAAGIGRGGAMDRRALAIANLLVGNGEDAAAIEVALFPFRFRATRDTCIAVTGADLTFSVAGLCYPSWWAVPLRAGETVELEPPIHGARAYLAFAGGIDVPVVLGSRATDLKSGFGGFEGRGLQRGDRLPLPAVAAAPKLPPEGRGANCPEARLPGRNETIGLRAIPAAEFAAFDADARHQIFAANWSVTGDGNRMGYRLAGPTLALVRPLELFSHGIAPGTVQVPPAGQPIIQLADANTCGGYPKIMTIIEPDLWKLAQAPAGARLRLIETTPQLALEAERQDHARFLAIRRALL